MRHAAYIIGQKIVLLSSVAALFFAAPTAAQHRSAGSINGFVRAGNARPLGGASVMLNDGRTGALTDDAGFFELLNVQPGTHKLVVTYLGFAQDTISVDVESGATVAERIVMHERALSIAPLLVQARVEGQARGLMEQRSADRLINVATAAVIRSRPDANIADAVGRLPGVALERDEGEGKYVQVRGTEPAFSNVTINGAHVPSPEGNTRVVKLDIVPASVVSEVQLSKTLTADMDADAIGGSLNLVTRAPESGGIFATFSALGGHTDLADRSAYNFGGAIGGRVGADERLGFLLDGSFDANYRPIADVEPVFDTGTLGGATVPIVSEIDQRDYRYNRSRFGFGGTLDYRLGEHSSLFMHGLYSNFHNYGTRYRADAVPSDGDVEPMTSSTGIASGGSIAREVQTRRPLEQIFSMTLGGNHDLTGVHVDYSGSYSHSQQRVSDGRSTSFSLDGVDYAYDASNPNIPTWTVTNNAPVGDPSAFSFGTFDIQNNLATDGEAAGQVNVKVPYAWGSLPASLKIGAKLRNDSKQQTDKDDIYSGYKGSFTLQDVVANFSDPNFYDNHYSMGPVPDANLVENFENQNLANFTYDRNKSLSKTEGANYTGSERVFALYGMQSLDIGQVHLLGGLRAEATHATYTANSVIFDAKKNFVGSTPVSGASDYTNLFPSVHMRIALDGATNLRFAATEAIARPVFSDLAPYLVTSQGLKTLSEGNPDLQPTHAGNLDVMLDHYDGAIGVFSIAGYYKKIDNFIFTRRTQLTTGDYAGYFASQPQNGQSGHLLGMEVEWQHRFTALPGALSGLGFDGNLNLASSRGLVPTDDGARNATLPRQGNANANAELTYDRNRLSFRGGLTYNAKNLWEYGDDATSDVYLDTHLQFDANASFAVNRDVRLIVQMLNLTNEVFGFYQGTPNTPIQREFYGRTLFLGVRYGR